MITVNISLSLQTIVLAVAMATDHVSKERVSAERVLTKLHSVVISQNFFN